MYVALVCPYDLRRPGGVRSHIAGLGRALSQRGHRVEIVAPTAATELESLPVVTCGAARTLAFGGTQIDLTWAAWRDVRDVSRRGYDVMHFHTIWNPLVPFQLAAMFRGRRIATFHDVPGPDTPAWAASLMSPASAVVDRIALDGLIAVSPSVSRYLPRRRHVIIPNGIRIPSLPPEGARDSILYLGRLEPRKGVRTLVEAAVRLGDACPPIFVAGDGPLRDQLRANAPRSVTFLGEVSDAEKWELLRRSRALVAPSVGGESFGIVLLEAMAAGAVPLAANNPGYAGVLADRGADLLFPVGDGAALAARIRALFSSDDLHRALQAWGTSYASRFSWDVLAPRVEAEYERAVAGSPRSGAPR